MTSLREEYKKFIDEERYGWMDENAEGEISVNPNYEAIYDFLITTLKERIEEELRPCLDHCREQNGRSDCKNCGLSEDTITRLLD